MVGHFHDTKAADALKAYLQGFCKSSCAGIADFVASKVERFDGGVFLSKIKHKDTVSGGLTGVEMHGKGVSIVNAHFRSHWVKTKRGY